LNRLEREENERLAAEKKAKLAEMKRRFELERAEKQSKEAEKTGGVVYKGQYRNDMMTSTRVLIWQRRIQAEAQCVT
jgi:hypothetical protein